MPRDAIKSGTVGKPLPNVRIGLVPETGEVTIDLPWMMLGYYNDPDKTAEMLRDGILYTGDQGEIDEQGYLNITGRISDTFKSSKGKFIVPGPIEWNFAKNNYVEQVCVAGLGIPQPIALVVLSEIGQQEALDKLKQSLQETLEHINSQLPNYEQLRAVVVVKTPWSVENGLLTPTMKVKRHELNRRYQHLFEEWYAKGEQLVWVQ
jgi:long-subunit acyl-CoA synthetase (AMP-forming)